MASSDGDWMIDALEYLFWGLIICYLALFLIGTIIGGFITIGMFISPEMTSLYLEKIILMGERLNGHHHRLRLKSEPSTAEVLE